MDKFASNLIQVVNDLQDKLGENVATDLPQIAVIGGQSSGKSSVLESIVGRDFLPRGSGIVTRRPLILQLISNKNISSAYGEFNHIKGKQFSDFNDIRNEITAETDREVGGNVGISAKPIILRIYSADVLDLTLVDLPGMVRVATKGQPQDIEKQIESMILEYILKDNCLILAVTAANQDLATSDALNLAKKVDPTGSRTIGILTKLDLMDSGTDASDILNGKHEISLKRDFIGVINRSQHDINHNKNIEDALNDEKDFFLNHPAYGPDMTDRLGIKYLREYLQSQLAEHIQQRLSPLKAKYETRLSEITDNLGTMDVPKSVEEKEIYLALIADKFRTLFDSAMGGKIWEVSCRQLSGGSKINLIMNDTYATEVDMLAYNAGRQEREIATAIQNVFGSHLGLFIPDAAFRACTLLQIEHFRKPSLECIDLVTEEIVTTISKCVDEIDCSLNLKDLLYRLSVDSIRGSTKRCKTHIEDFVDTEKSYINTNHEDFRKMIGDIKSLPLSDDQLKVTAQVVQQNSLKDWIFHKKQDYWFMLKGTELLWFKDDKLKDKKGSININNYQLKPIDSDELTLTLVSQKKVGLIGLGLNEVELVFKTKDMAEKWRQGLRKTGPKFYAADNNNNNNNNTNPGQLARKDSVANVSLSEMSQSSDDMAFPDHMRPQVDEVKKLIVAYITILKKIFKDRLPKECQSKLVNTTSLFIGSELLVRIRQQFPSIDDILGTDPNKELRQDLLKQSQNFTEAIAIIDNFSRQKA